MNIDKDKVLKNKEKEMKDKKERKLKKSILDPFKDEIKYLVDLEITVPNIAKLMNEKTPIKLVEQTYRKYIKTRL